MIPTFLPRQVGAEWVWNNQRDANREGNYTEDGSTDINGNPLYAANGDSNPLAGDAYSHATDPDSLIAYWLKLNYPRWKYPASYKKTRKTGETSTGTVSWYYSQAWRIGGWERVEPYPCLGPQVKDEDDKYYTPVYTETNPAPTVNPETDEADAFYYDNGYKAQENRGGWGTFVEHSIRYAEVPDDLTEYDLGVKPTWIRPFLAKFTGNYNSFNWVYGNGHNGFEIHKDHYDEYDVTYGDGEDGTIAPVFLNEKKIEYTVDEGGPNMSDMNALYKEEQKVIPVAQTYNRPRHKKYLGVTHTWEIKKEIRETNIEYDYFVDGSSLVEEKFDIDTVSYTLSYGSEHIYEFDTNKPYDSDPDRNASTPPPDIATWPKGSLDNVTYTGYTNDDPTSAGYPDVYTENPSVPPSDDFSSLLKYVSYGGWGFGGGSSGIALYPWTGLGPPTNGEGSFTFTYSNFLLYRYGLPRMTYAESLRGYNLTKFEYYGFGKIGAD